MLDGLAEEHQITSLVNNKLLPFVFIPFNFGIIVLVSIHLVPKKPQAHKYKYRIISINTDFTINNLL